MGWFTRRLGRGARGEQIAARHLQAAGYRILKRNWRNRFGEVDLIARAADGTLVLVEVKTGTHGQHPPETRVNRAKQRQLTSLGAQALRRFAPDGRARFDIVAVELAPDGAADGSPPVVRHLQGAFESRV